MEIPDAHIWAYWLDRPFWTTGCPYMHIRTSDRLTVVTTYDLFGSDVMMRQFVMLPWSAWHYAYLGVAEAGAHNHFYDYAT